MTVYRSRQSWWPGVGPWRIYYRNVQKPNWTGHCKFFWWTRCLLLGGKSHSWPRARLHDSKKLFPPL